MEKRQWSDLPCELLSEIANGLGIIELLSFRGVCKNWQFASSSASVHTSLQSEPWFLLHGQTDLKCSLLNNQGKKYSISIPEMDGATCHASFGGWLLLFREASMFFFCPFSRAKIDLPRCPFSELSDHVAGFSSPPTCQDCRVAVISHLIGFELKLFLLCRGSNRWTEHKYCTPPMKIIRGYAYQEGAFHFIDGFNGLVTFHTESKEWKRYFLVPPSDNSDCETLNYDIRPSLTQDMKRRLRLKDTVSITTCPTLIPRTDTNEYDLIIQREWILATEGCNTRSLKGVWIQPRYFQISPDQSW